MRCEINNKEFFVGNLAQLYAYFSIYGIGLHVLIAIFFAIHAVRSGHGLYWLWILFVFPFLGSVVYFFAIFLPNSRMQYGFRHFSAETSRILNPNKELVAARRAYSLTASVHNHMRVANALRVMGKFAEAVSEYESCLKRASDSDLQVRLAAAYANFDLDQHQRVLALLSDIRAKDANYHVQDVTLLAALTLAEMGQNDAAREQFEYLMRCFNSVEISVEYAIWLLKQGEREQANAVKERVEQTASHWNKHARSINKYTIQRLNSAFKIYAKS